MTKKEAKKILKTIKGLNTYEEKRLFLYSFCEVFNFNIDIENKTDEEIDLGINQIRGALHNV